MNKLIHIELDGLNEEMLWRNTIAINFKTVVI